MGFFLWTNIFNNLNKKVRAHTFSSIKRNKKPGDGDDVLCCCLEL